MIGFNYRENDNRGPKMPGKLTNRKKQVAPEDRKHHAFQEGHQGEDHQCAKLTEDQVYDLRREHKQGMEPEHLAAKYQVSERRIVELLTGRAWPHLHLKDIYRRRPKPPKVVHRAKCRHCQEEFTARTAGRKYCSNKCVTESQRGKQVEER